MQVFTPYAEPLRVAEALDPKRLRSQINECKVILRALRGESDAWANHPVCKQYGSEQATDYLISYMNCLYSHLVGDGFGSIMHSNLAMQSAPDFLTQDFIDQHKRRLYTKNPAHYAQWAELGTSDANGYFVNGEYVRYVNGKKL